MTQRLMVFIFLVAQVVSLEPGVPVAGLDLKQQNNNLVVVKLPSTLTNPSRSHALQKAGDLFFPPLCSCRLYEQLSLPSSIYIFQTNPFQHHSN